MLVGSDVSGRHTGPAVNQSLSFSLFYMLSVIAMAFVVINMVVGVFVDAYYKALAEQEKQQTADNADHRKPALKAKDLPNVFEDPPMQSFREHLLMVVTNKKFDMLIALFICSNVVAMAFQSYKRHAWQTMFDEVSSAFFALVFGAECVLKMAAMRPRRYFDDNFNKFDFSLVMVTFLGYVVESLGDFVDIDPSTVQLLRMLRIVRILRALRLIRAFKGLQVIMRTLVLSGSACGNLIAMLILMFFMFSVVLVNRFGTMCVAGDEARPGKLGVTCLFTPNDSLLDRHAHFQGVGIAIYTLFRIATGDAWGEVMESATLETPRGLGWGFSYTPREPVSDAAWGVYLRLMLPSANVTQAAATALEIAKEALDEWYALVQGREDEEGWPLPNGDGADYVTLARLVLPNCLTAAEAMYLQEHGVADCAVPGSYHSSGPLDCSTTCGYTPIFVYTIFYLFFAVAAFVLFQLVIGVLMDIYLRVQEEAAAQPVCPGCDYLTITILKRMHRRWLMHARAKLHGFEHSAIVSHSVSMKRTWGVSNRIGPVASQTTDKIIGPRHAHPPPPATAAANTSEGTAELAAPLAYSTNTACTTSVTATDALGGATDQMHWGGGGLLAQTSEYTPGSRQPSDTPLSPRSDRFFNGGGNA